MNSTGNKTRILFVGPMGFNPNSWQTRSTYILPDLFAPLRETHEIFMLTGSVPNFARKSLDQLCSRFSIRQFEIDKVEYYGTENERWMRATEAAALTLRPAVITNIFGSQVLGEVIGRAAKAINARAIVRVAGDEISSRKALGVYRDHPSRFESEVRAERQGFLDADSIIAMSPWEKKRICGIIGPEHESKIKVCIRGVDLSRFHPKTEETKTIKRFLYVGRKSAEKGFDVIEAAAKLVLDLDPTIEFVFVGDFEKRKLANCNYLGWIKVDELPALFRSVDAFLLTSRSEGFPQVVAEAMAVGLPCIVTRQLFAPVLEHGKDAFLTSLAPEEVAENIIKLARHPDIARAMSLRARQFAENSLGHEYWMRRYAAVISDVDFTEDSALDVPLKTWTATSQDSAQLRILMIVPRQLGLMGTPGAYYLAEAFFKQTKIQVICNVTSNSGIVPVVHTNAELPVIEIDFSESDYCEQILAVAEKFRPDIVHVVNWHGWVKVIPYLKFNYNAAKYVIDFKTPLMAEGAKRTRLRRDGGHASTYVDLVVSRNVEDIDSWIRGNQAPIFVYPLGVSTSSLKIRVPGQSDVRKCRRFVYIGSFHEKRRLDVLIDLIASLPEDLKSLFFLDLFGSGGDVEALNAQIVENNLADRVVVHDALPQDELFSVMATYDGGIAWVPKDFYDAAPSIKFLEYAGTGLTILATDTSAHRKNIEWGFKAELFSESREAFIAAMRKLLLDGVSEFEIRNNLQRIKEFDWDEIVKHQFLPVFHHLLDGSPYAGVGIAQAGGTQHQVTVSNSNDRLVIPSKPVQIQDHWTPALIPFDSTRAGIADLTVMGIVSERLYYGLRSECRFLPLPESGCLDTLRTTRPDFILIESCLQSVLGDWHFSCVQEISRSLDMVIRLAREQNIPVVAWVTADVAYAEIYTRLARCVDHVFAADPRMVEYLEKKGCNRVDLLRPAIQPRLFNPLRPLLPEVVDFSPYLVAGTGLPESFSEVRQIISTLNDISFTGFERTHVPTRNQLQRLNRLESNYSTRGRLSHRMLPEVLKNSHVIITDSRARVTRTEAEWQALENAACMSQTFRLSIFPDSDGLESDYFRVFSNQDELIDCLKASSVDIVGMSAEGQKSWRKAFTNDTFEQRMEVIAEKLGLAFRRPRVPVASIITPTMRPDRIAQILHNYDRQDFPNKELVIVVNSDQARCDDIRGMVAGRQDVQVWSMPIEHYAASTLNIGVKASKGDFVFRFDDDDFYGERYVSDAMLMLKADSPDLIGKFSSFIKINGADTIYMRPASELSRTKRAFVASDLSHRNAAISGATFCISARLLRDFPLPDSSLASADTAYLELLRVKAPDTRIVKTDWFSYTTGRDDNHTAHTWRVDSSTLIDESRTLQASLTEVPR